MLRRDLREELPNRSWVECLGSASCREGEKEEVSKDDPEEMDETWLVGKKGKCEEGCEELGLERSNSAYIYIYISGYLGRAAGMERAGGGGGAGLTWVFALLLASRAKRQTVGRRHFARWEFYGAEWDGMFDGQNFKGFVLCSRLSVCGLQSCVAKL